MATNHTTNYNLNLWEPSDAFVREEFNENSEKLEAALTGLQAGQLKLYTGSYKGTGTTDFSFEIPVTPKVMVIQKTILYKESLFLFGDYCMMHVQTTSGQTAVRPNGDRFTLTITGNTVHIHTSFESSYLDYTQVLNMMNCTYAYFILA